jgi:ATP-binding cassette, subfamily C, bacterial LapB
MTSIVESDFLAESLRSDGVSQFEASSNFASCLLPLLSSLGWSGMTDDLMGALPYFASRLDLIDFRNTLAELGFNSHRHFGRLNDIDARMMPCLFLPSDEPPIVVHHIIGTRATVFDSASKSVAEIDPAIMKGYYYTFEAISQSKNKVGGESWVRRLYGRFKKEIVIIATASLLSSIFSLAIPLFVIVAYDMVIPAGSVDSLYALLPGLALALIVDYMFRRARSRALACLTSAPMGRTEGFS